MLRVRFQCNPDDPRPVNWPVKHPYWITGYAGDDSYATVVSYADHTKYIMDNWPDAKDLEVQVVDSYSFTDRFPKPEWFSVPEEPKQQTTYDSKQDTEAHIRQVRTQLFEMIAVLQARSHLHDYSKLEEPEKSMYDEFTPKLRGMTYGSDEYKECLKAMGPALQNHYQVNTHHPEHFENGINGMSLLDLLEMLADWKAAGMRHADGNMAQSLEVNRKRFGMSDQLFEIFQNTVKELEW